MLAIHGGEPVRTQPFPQWPQAGPEEKYALLSILEGENWWRGSGTHVAALEKEFADYHGAPAALAVTNGTHALELALQLLSIGPGCEVIVPAYTFISTAMAVQRIGAIPVPVDVDIETYCMDPSVVRQMCSENTKAIIPVSMAGHTAPLDDLREVARSLDLALIHDAAHAHGATYRGLAIGSLGHVACFSFQNYKLMSAGEGGMLVFPSTELRDTAYLLHNCGRPYGDTQYAHIESGSNYRMNEFSASILRCQLNRLPQQNELRERHALQLTDALAGLDGVIPQGRRSYSTLHPYYAYQLLIDRGSYPHVSRNLVVDALKAEGIPAFRNYPLVYDTEAFWKGPTGQLTKASLSHSCPNSQVISRDGFWIHHRVLLGDERALLDVATALRKVINALK